MQMMARSRAERSINHSFQEGFCLARTELRHEGGRAEEDTVPPNPHAIQVEKRLEVERCRDPAQNPPKFSPKSPIIQSKFALDLPRFSESWLCHCIAIRGLVIVVQVFHVI